MKALRIIGYIVGTLFLALAVLIGVATYLDYVDPPKPGQLSQTMIVGGKTVHFVSTGPVSYKTSNEGDTILFNGQALELPEGDEFTLTISPDGSKTLRPGKP